MSGGKTRTARLIKARREVAEGNMTSQGTETLLVLLDRIIAERKKAPAVTGAPKHNYHNRQGGKCQWIEQ